MKEVILNKIRIEASNFNIEDNRLNIECSMIYKNLIKSVNNDYSLITDDLIIYECELFYNNN